MGIRCDVVGTGHRCVELVRQGRVVKSDTWSNRAK